MSTYLIIGASSGIGKQISAQLSEKAGWINGKIFHVDGGLSVLRV